MTITPKTSWIGIMLFYARLSSFGPEVHAVESALWWKPHRLWHKESWGDRTGLLQLTQHLAVSLESNFPYMQFAWLSPQNIWKAGSQKICNGTYQYPFYVEWAELAKRERSNKKWLKAERDKEAPWTMSSVHQIPCNISHFVLLMIKFQVSVMEEAVMQFLSSIQTCPLSRY